MSLYPTPITPIYLRSEFCYGDQNTGSKQEFYDVSVIGFTRQDQPQGKTMATSETINIHVAVLHHILGALKLQNVPKETQAHLLEFLSSMYGHQLPESNPR